MFRHAARANLARVGDFDRPQLAFVARIARAAMDAVTQPNTPRRPSGGFGAIDPSAAGRAQAAFNAVFSRFQGLIDAIANDPSLTPDQRASAIRGLRQQQAAEAGAAQKRIMDEERAAALMRRNMEKNEL
jgi:hypothetical protein